MYLAHIHSAAIVRALTCWIACQLCSPLSVAAAASANPPVPQLPPPNVPDTAAYGIIDSILHAGFSEQIIMLLLALFSVVSWAIIAHKGLMLRGAKQRSNAFLHAFWESKHLDEIYQATDQTIPANPVGNVFRAGYIELAKLKRKHDNTKNDTQLGALESIERSMRRTATAELTRMESFLSFLGTTGSTAPFIGLLGTVIGIMSAFQRIGLEKNAGLDTVAPGIGGALMATAFGLIAAIPAVIAYNAFLARIRVLDSEMDNFSADFLNIVKRNFF